MVVLSGLRSGMCFFSLIGLLGGDMGQREAAKHAYNAKENCEVAWVGHWFRIV